jgi:hypothetical protein
MPSATVRGQYPTLGAILDPPQFLLDTTFKDVLPKNILNIIITKKAIENCILENSAGFLRFTRSAVNDF